MQGVTSEELVVTLTERGQALHHRVEVIVRKIIEEHTHFGWWLLELKAMVDDGLDGSRYQC